MILFLAGMVTIGLLQVPGLVRKRDWRMLAAFGALWVIATIYGSLVFAGVAVPSPVRLVVSLLERLTRSVGLP